MSEILTAQPGTKLYLLGNEAVVRGALENGISVAATYPGTPSSEIGDVFMDVAKDAGMYFEFSTNEKVLWRSLPLPLPQDCGRLCG